MRNRLNLLWLAAVLLACGLGYYLGGHPGHPKYPKMVEDCVEGDFLIRKDQMYVCVTGKWIEDHTPATVSGDLPVGNGARKTQ